MYRVEIRDELGNITLKEFKTFEDADKYYCETQLLFTAIEMRLIDPNGEIKDHCYLCGSKLEPIWI